MQCYTRSYSIGFLFNNWGVSVATESIDGWKAEQLGLIYCGVGEDDPVCVWDVDFDLLARYHNISHPMSKTDFDTCDEMREYIQYMIRHFTMPVPLAHKFFADAIEFGYITEPFQDGRFETWISTQILELYQKYLIRKLSN